MTWLVYTGADVPVRRVDFWGLLAFLWAGPADEYVYPFRPARRRSYG